MLSCAMYLLQLSLGTPLRLHLLELKVVLSSVASRASSDVEAAVSPAGKAEVAGMFSLHLGEAGE